MLSVQPMILAAALTATGGNVEMLEFTATWYGPCKTMKGTVEQIKSMGYTVHSIDFDRHKNVVQRFQVTQVPTYIVVSQGREDRVGNGPDPHLQRGAIGDELGDVSPDLPEEQRLFGQREADPALRLVDRQAEPAQLGDLREGRRVGSPGGHVARAEEGPDEVGVVSGTERPGGVARG